MNIFFSVIMPTYSRKKCIKDAIDSLFSQTYQNFELIIIDDGSIDRTEEYIKDIYRKDIEQGKIKYIKLSKNVGASVARNEGLKFVKNEWVVYLDTDNKMTLTYLETYSKCIYENPNYKTFYAKIRHRNSGIIIGHEFNFEELSYQNYIDMGIFVHHVDLLKELGGFDPDIKRVDDWDLILKYTYKYKPFFIDEILLDYYDGEDFQRITHTGSYFTCYKKTILNYLKRLDDESFFNRLNSPREKDNIIKEKESEIYKINFDLQNKNQLINDKNTQLNDILNSNSWRITKPIRLILDKIKRINTLSKKSFFVLKNEGLKIFLKKIVFFLRKGKIVNQNEYQDLEKVLENFKKYDKQ